jgi:Leishmanolysin
MIVWRSHLATPNGIFLFARRLLTLGVASMSLACGGADSPVGIVPPPNDFIIDLRYLSPVSETQRAIIAAAVDKWSRALSKDRGGFRFNTAANKCFAGAPRLDEEHRSPVIFLSVANVDRVGGLLAYTQICEVSPRDTLPVLSHIRIDLNDIALLENAGTLLGVMTHELGHALGFVPVTYLAKKLAAGGKVDPHLNGPAARAQFQERGAWYTGLTVPLEDASGDGPNNPHWRFMVFGDEVMSSSIITGYRSPLSVITLGLFQDLGYNVDFSVADSYVVTPLFGGTLMLPEFNLGNDLRAAESPPLVPPATAP